MAKLTTKNRNAMPASDFAGKNRSYPIKGTGSAASDREHAANAKARATQMENVGKLSPNQADMIRAKANKVLKK